MQRKERLATGEIYHIYSRSIAEFKIFNKNADFLRMENILRFYKIEGMRVCFSRFIQLDDVVKYGFIKYFTELSMEKQKVVQVIAYCIMPTHLHLILKQLKDEGISTFVGNVLNSYSRYFNIQHKRKGPLWECRFKNVLVKSDEQLLHLTRYIHLNPVTDYLVNLPEDWHASSYKEYIRHIDTRDAICEFKGLLDIGVHEYKKFVDDRIGYQRELAKIKEHIFH